MYLLSFTSFFSIFIPMAVNYVLRCNKIIICLFIHSHNYIIHIHIFIIFAHLPHFQEFDLQRLNKSDQGRIAHYLNKKHRLHISGTHRLFFSSAVSARCNRVDTSTLEYIGKRERERESVSVSVFVLYLCCVCVCVCVCVIEWIRVHWNIQVSMGPNWIGQGRVAQNKIGQD